MVGVGCAKYSNLSSLQITMQMLIGSPFFESNWGKKSYLGLGLRMIVFRSWVQEKTLSIRASRGQV